MSESKLIVSQFKESRKELKTINNKTAEFLKRFCDDFNAYINDKSHVSVAIKDPVYKFGEFFPVHFNLDLLVSLDGNNETYTRHCTAREVDDREYRINDGMAQHTFYMSESNNRGNERTFDKFIENFTSQFFEFKDMPIEIK